MILVYYDAGYKYTVRLPFDYKANENIETKLLFRDELSSKVAFFNKAAIESDLVVEQKDYSEIDLPIVTETPAAVYVESQENPNKLIGFVNKSAMGFIEECYPHTWGEGYQFEEEIEIPQEESESVYQEPQVPSRVIPYQGPKPEEEIENILPCPMEETTTEHYIQTSGRTTSEAPNFIDTLSNMNPATLFLVLGLGLTGLYILFGDR
jgi:hypothetical protein